MSARPATVAAKTPRLRQSRLLIPQRAIGVGHSLMFAARASHRELA